MFTCYTANIVSYVYLFSLIFTQFTYFPQDVSETHSSLHSTEPQLILRYENARGRNKNRDPTLHLDFGSFYAQMQIMSSVSVSVSVYCEELLLEQSFIVSLNETHM